MRFNSDCCLLYAVTDRSYLNGRTMKEAVEAALRGGITMLQLREKHLAEAEFEQEAREILTLCRSYGVPLIINDNVSLCARIGADGVHVGQNDMSAEEVRAILGRDKIIGVTAKTPEQARAAESAGADYLGCGTCFPTSTKPEALPMTFDHFQKVCSSVSIPVVAIGGIGARNITSFAGRGMQGFAISGGIFGVPDIEAETRKLKTLAEELIHR